MMRLKARMPLSKLLARSLRVQNPKAIFELKIILHKVLFP